MAAGIWMVNTPIIDSASTTNSPANSTMIQVCWNSAWTWLPAAATAIPASGIGARHAQYVGQRQHEGARRGDVGAVARDDSGEDRHHRQHAGCEGQQQSQSEEGAQNQQQIAVADQGREPILFRDETCGAGATPAGAASGAAAARAAAGRARRRQRDRQGLGDRRIAQAGMGAALVGDIHRDIHSCRRRRVARPAAWR